MWLQEPIFQTPLKQKSCISDLYNYLQTFKTDFLLLLYMFVKFFQRMELIPVENIHWQCFTNIVKFPCSYNKTWKGNSEMQSRNLPNRDKNNNGVILPLFAPPRRVYNIQWLLLIWTIYKWSRLALISAGTNSFTAIRRLLRALSTYDRRGG